MPQDELAGRVLALLGEVVPDRAVDEGFALAAQGLESLAVTRLRFGLRAAFGVDLPMDWLRGCPSAADLIARVRADSAASAAAAANPPTAATTAAAPGAEFEPFPLTDLQQAYLVAKGQDGPDPIGCHVYREFEVDDLDVAALEHAWRALVAHHAVLRTVITPDGRQRVQRDVTVPPIPVHGLAKIAAVRERLSHRRYAPGEWPMYTVEVCHTPNGSSRVHLSIDALIVDGHGLGVLLDDWSRLYHDPACQLAEPDTTVRDCILELTGRQRGERYRRELDYWRQRLAALPAGPGPLLPAHDGQRRTPLSATLSPAHWSAIGELAAAWDVSPTALIATVFAETFARQAENRPLTLVLTGSHRPSLSVPAENLVGPFTSSVVVALPATSGRPLREAAAEAYRLLWQDLEHAEVSGVAALRAARAADRTAVQPELGVVFTSMLGVGRAGADGFAGAVTYALSQTSGVALDHQMWTADGALHVRWDVAEDRFPPGEARVLFAAFVNALRTLTPVEPERRALNELQQAYFVTRATQPPAPWDGCQVAHAFEVDGPLDLPRLEAAWLRLVRAYEGLRTVVTHDGTLAIAADAPDRWEIPVVDLSAVPDPDDYLRAQRERTAGRAYPLGRGPQFEIRVTTGHGPASTVHLVTDLTILDGRSIHYVVRELFDLYADPDREPALPAPHSEYTRQRTNAASEPGHADRVDYWRRRVDALESGPRVVSAPEDRRRERFEGVLPGWRAVRQCAEAAGLTGDDLLAAAFTHALAEEFGAPFSLPVVRWTPDTARYRPGEYTALSWLTRVDAGTDLWEQAAAFRAVLTADAAADGASGLAQLRRRVARERRTGAFELPIVYTGILDVSEQQLPDGVRLGPWLTCTPDVVLDCISLDEGDELRFHWDGVPAAFPPGRLAALFDRYRELIHSLAEAAPDADNRSGLFDPSLTWNDTDRPFPAYRQAHLAFADQAALRPEAIALRWSNGTMTFGELNRRANRIAWALREQGVRPGTGVGISVKRGPAMAAATYGVLKAGGFYVPIEPGLPQGRAEAILEDSAVRLVVTDEQRGPSAWNLPADVRAVAVESQGQPEHDPAPDPAASVDDLAYVIFTSGSTGRPKGVAVTHRPLLNLFAWCARTHGFGPEDVGLCVTSHGFDLSVFDLLGLLGYGASLYIANESEQRDPRLLLDVLLREPITFWNSAPTTLNQLAPLLPDCEGRPGTETLRLVYLSGDYTPLPLPDTVRGVFPGARIVSLGGATEATVWSNWFEVGAIDPAWRSIPYGRPIDNARYYILDERGARCAVGVEGDLYIGGDCLAEGYYRRPELTRERFVPDPFRGRPGARMYRTGDRASFYPDGVICFLGRADGQVKIRGFRVELDEVAYRLREHPAVKDVVVTARQDPSGDRRLVAYVQPAGELPPGVGELRRHAAAALPDYMVPNVVAFVDTFPATDNGKLDRGALPWPVEPGSSHVLSRAAAAPPDTDHTTATDPALDTATSDAATLSGELAEIFAELLGLPEVDPEADIWDQGATSFTMVQVSAALRERHGLQVPVSALLADPTVGGIARALADLQPDAPGSDTNQHAVPDSSRPTTAETTVHNQPAAPAPASMSESAAHIPSAPADRPVLDFFSAADREAFKRERRDLLRLPADAPTIRLEPGSPPTTLLADRATRREFGAGPIPHRDFTRLLGLLREYRFEGRSRRLYPSAGDTYSVQVYVRVRPGAVEGVPGALYYYHPVEHALRLVEEHATLDRSQHFVYNRPVFDAAGFELYLVGRSNAIEPLYGDDAERYQLLEAGYLGQVLLGAQATCGIGLCPIGAVALEQLRGPLGLDAGGRYLHAFLGGRLVDHPAAADPNDVSADPALVVDLPDVRTAPQSAREVAVVGAACRFPGADDLDAYWSNLSRGVRSLGPVPAARRDHFPENAPPGGYLADIDRFDSLLFRVPPVEAATLDPQLRLLLPAVWRCLEDAGHSAASLNEAGRVGVFLAAMWQDYQHVSAERAAAGLPAAIGATASEAANRVSHYFGFQGPSLAVDASCSSSLAALHLAVESLRRGECESALVAATNVCTHPDHVRLLTEYGLLSGVSGDGAGWAPGEGVAAVLLRTRRAADQDADTPYAYVTATRIGHAGGAGRFGSPQAPALAASIRATLRAADLDPEQVDYVECAAAGAVLADAAEAEALGAVFDSRPVRTGTVKPNLGHLEAAAGLSQLIKVLLQLRHGLIAPTLLDGHAAGPADWPAPIRPVADLSFWTGNGPRHALVTAVGATGSLGHAVLRAAAVDRQPSDEVRDADDGRPTSYAFPLSAQTDGQLAEYAGLLRSYVEERPGLRLGDVAFTLQSRRAHHARRAVVAATGYADLLAGLDQLARGRTVPASADATSAAWTRGEHVDWSGHRPSDCRAVPLPGYPFAEESYRLSKVPATGSKLADTSAWREAEPDVASDVEHVANVSAVDYLVGVFAQISGIAADRIDPHAPLEDYGLSSALIVQLTARLRADLGDMPSTLFFAHRTLASVATALPVPDRSAQSERPVPSASVAAPVRAPEADERRIAIIGIAGRYPGANDLSAFWANLHAGRDLIGELPSARRDAQSAASPPIGGFLDDIAAFDPLFFSITPRDAAAMDPQERLFLQVAWHTFEDAGLTRAVLRRRHGGRVGVFVGSMYNEYPFFGLRTGNPVGSAIAGIANRASYFFGFHGPSMTVDTMCASSLTAVHLAIAALRRGECETALVGGVNLSMHSNKFATLSALKMASSDHRCRSFGADGDGFVPGEGVGAVLLKPLDRAVADGDRIHAVLRGTAVNHDGKTNGYTVPDPALQAEVVAGALRDAGLSAADLGYIEAHGTGTQLGDPIEIDGLGRVFAEAGLPPGSRAIGSVKSAIGHLEAAAGIAGLTKAVLQLRHDAFVPSLHAERLNPHIDWTRSPLRVQREAAAWPADLPRRIGISSFGAGGANAHAIVEAYAAPEPPDYDDGGPQLVVLSARTDDRLRALAGRWIAALEEPRDDRDGGPSLGDFAYTSQIGREEMAERLAVVAHDKVDLALRLRRYLAGDDYAVVRGRTTTTRPGDAALEDLADLDELAAHWVVGGAVDWSALHPMRRHIVDAPGYPFVELRCWVDEPGSAGNALQPTASSAEQTPTVPLAARTWEPENEAESGFARTPFGELSGTVLCFTAGDHRGLEEAFRPAKLIVLRQGIDYADAEGAIEAARRALASHGQGGALTGVLDLSALGEDEARDECDAGPWIHRLAALQRLLADNTRRPLRIVQVTSGLFGLAGPRPHGCGARMAGFVRGLGAEYPAVRATVLDTDQPHDARSIADVWLLEDEYGMIAVRNGVRHLPRLNPLAVSASTAAPWTANPDAVYLVTGATRGIGALVARHLVRRGARRLAITGLNALPPRHLWIGDALDGRDAIAARGIRELEGLGARVMTFTGPLSRREELSAFLADVRSALGPIGGIVHCAGRGSAGPAPLLRKSTSDLLAVLEPKGDGLDALLASTVGDLLEFVVLFSSVSAAFPRLGVGVGDYAAANTRMDLLAECRALAGDRVVRAVNWPVWSETGSGVARPGAAAAVGLRALSDVEGLAVLDQVLGRNDVPVLVPIPAVDGGFDADAALRVRPTSTATSATEVVLASGATSAPTPAGSSLPAASLVSVFCETVGISEPDLDFDAEFGDLGIESVLLAELIERIEGVTGRPLEPAALLEHSTLRRLSAHLSGTGHQFPGMHAAQRPDTPEPRSATSLQSSARPADDQRIAVVGIACRFPDAPDLDAYWRLLRDGRCAVGEVPPGRWDVAALYSPTPAPGRSISRWGGFLDRIEDFDPDWFGIGDDEARDLDPAIRLTLEAAAVCLSDAGYRAEELRGGDTGIFVGARMSGYRRRIGHKAAATGLGGDQNFIAARLAHQFDLHGPALVVDSACSSALVAVQLAARSLLAGESRMALAGGVEVLLDEEPYLEFSAAKALSARGRCAAFDRSADGFVPGEGCGVLLLKTLTSALADGDRIHAVLDAVAVGNDGRTMGLTTPNPAAQAAVVRRALTLAARSAAEVGLVEAHGTGTLIGDPIELRALTDVYREHTDRSGYCAIGSAKSNLGHLLSAAGIAGLIKALLCVEHGEIAPTVFCDDPNPRFDFAASPFEPARVARPWPGPRVAGVSAFGLGGTNAHAIVSQAPEHEANRAPLPAPEFSRRRLWWERPDGHVEPEPVRLESQAAVTLPAAPAPAPLVASILELSFDRLESANGKALP